MSITIHNNNNNKLGEKKKLVELVSHNASNTKIIKGFLMIFAGGDPILFSADEQK